MRTRPLIHFFISTNLLLFLFSYPSVADSRLQDEIHHLMEYTRNSNCIFIRNGRDHSPEDAARHMLRKYDHFKDKISTTEEFIELCATQSTLTRQPYEIRCPNQKSVESSYWFRMELQKLRNEKDRPL